MDHVTWGHLTYLAVTCTQQAVTSRRPTLLQAHCDASPPCTHTCQTGRSVHAAWAAAGRVLAAGCSTHSRRSKRNGPAGPACTAQLTMASPRSTRLPGGCGVPQGQARPCCQEGRRRRQRRTVSPPLQPPQSLPACGCSYAAAAGRLDGGICAAGGVADGRRWALAGVGCIWRAQVRRGCQPEAREVGYGYKRGESLQAKIVCEKNFRNFGTENSREDIKRKTKC